MPMNEVHSKAVAIVTGASSGIGAAVVPALADAGYSILVAGRDAARTNAVCEGLDGAVAWTGDLRRSAACEALVAKCNELFGRLDVLVNNAGIYRPNAAEATSDEDWQETLDINLSSPFYLSRAALPLLRKARGAIINIASDWGIVGGREAVAYCASKGGLVLMTKAMALDHAGEGIRINAICPGDVETPMLYASGETRGRDPEEALAACNAASPTGRVTRPDEVAGLVVYLASDAARQVTGAAISIDGGNTAG